MYYDAPPVLIIMAFHNVTCNLFLLCVIDAGGLPFVSIVEMFVFSELVVVAHLRAEMRQPEHAGHGRTSFSTARLFQV